MHAECTIHFTGCPLVPTLAGPVHGRGSHAAQDSASWYPGRGNPVTVRLLTNIGRLWTGSEFIGNAAILISDDRIAWVGPSAELPRSVARRRRR